jgi:2-methylcitrate dehydratase PrpD
MSAIEKLARFVSQYRTADMTDEQLHHAKRAVIDWHGALYSGTLTEPIKLLEQSLEDELGHGKARLALGRTATARLAALINGAASHAAEVDDSFRDAMVHPGSPTIAATLTAAQEVNTTGAEFLRAVIVGYEISTRIGVVMGRSHYRYWHSTGTIGTFGAAAGAGAIYGLDETALAHALATAGTFAAGLQQAFRNDSMSKPLHAGRAAEAGILASKLARNGITGALDILDGEAGLGKAMSTDADWTQVAATLGNEFNIARLTFKNHIGCGHTFAAIDAVLELRRLYALDHRNIKNIRVKTYRPAIEIARYDSPATANEARFSLKYIVAAAMFLGSVRIAAYDDAMLESSELKALIARTEVEVDPELDARFPKQRAAYVEVETLQGEKLTHFQPNRKGDPEAPMSDSDLNEKMLELTSPVIGKLRAEHLLTKLATLEKIGDVAEELSFSLF